MYIPENTELREKMNIEDKILELKLKGFSEDEIIKIAKTNKSTVKKVSLPDDVKEQSLLLYSFMQKDLSRLVMLETPKKDRDSQVIFNAIKLQADLQQKKIDIANVSKDSVGKISKSWIMERDGQISAARLAGAKPEDIAKDFNLSVQSVRQALDRVELGLDFEISPSIISETIGLPKRMRLQVLKEAHSRNLSRDKVRKMANNIKNKVRGK